MLPRRGIYDGRGPAVSELIAQLEALKEEYGDLPVLHKTRDAETAKAIDAYMQSGSWLTRKLRAIAAWVLKDKPDPKLLRPTPQARTGVDAFYTPAANIYPAEYIGL